MLINCPECDHQVSDKAGACISCAFPIREHFTELKTQQALEEERASRRSLGEVDCPPCDARGFCMKPFVTDKGESKEGFAWCKMCAHSGRAVLCESNRGYFAVSSTQLTVFLAGDVDEDAHEEVVFIGTEKPTGFRYPKQEAVAESTEDKNGSR